MNVKLCMCSRSSGLMEVPDQEDKSSTGDTHERRGGSPSTLMVNKPMVSSSPRGSRIDLSRLHFELPKFGGAKPLPAKSEALKRAKARERKAARTLAVITGSFIVCWLPFFIVALVRPFCTERCYFSPLLVSIINWLGYFNSLLNPVIYTVFNPDFRSAFRKILFAKYRSQQP